MQTCLTSQKQFLRFNMLRVSHATIHRADRCTLRFFVKTDTFGAFIGYDVVEIVGNRHLYSCRINDSAILEFIIAMYICAIADFPFYTAFINGFDGAEDYWEKASSQSHLPNIKIPSLLVTALDDSFLSDTCYPRELAASSDLFHLEMPKFGGHLGFMSPDTEGSLWSENRAFEFYKQTV